MCTCLYRYRVGGGHLSRASCILRQPLCRLRPPWDPQRWAAACSKPCAAFCRSRRGTGWATASTSTPCFTTWRLPKSCRRGLCSTTLHPRCAHAPSLVRAHGWAARPTTPSLFLIVVFCLCPIWASLYRFLVPSQDFSPTTKRRGVGQHPHRGFETITLAFQGAVRELQWVRAVAPFARTRSARTTRRNT